MSFDESDQQVKDRLEPTRAIPWLGAKIFDWAIVAVDNNKQKAHLLL